VGGDECEVCGRSLAEPPRLDAPVLAMEGLEPTGLGDLVAVGAVAPMAELEATRQPDAGPVRLEPVPELEPTRAEPVDAPGELVPDLEPTAAAPSGDAPTELPLFPVCRYCRTPAGPGERICGRCGMALPAGPARAAEASSAPPLCSCGTPITRSICPACGARNQAA